MKPEYALVVNIRSNIYLTRIMLYRRWRRSCINNDKNCESAFLNSDFDKGPRTKNKCVLYAFLVFRIKRKKKTYIWHGSFDSHYHNLLHWENGRYQCFNIYGFMESGYTINKKRLYIMNIYFVYCYLI